MELTNPAATSGQTSARSPANGKGGAALSSDFETFLNMLTAQMRNQDPLNPVESTDFAVQLATFSTVEQQVRTNDLLGSLHDRMGAQGAAQLSQWMGLEARVAAPVRFEGQPVAFTAKVAPGAERAQLVVRDPDGAVAQRQDIPARSGPVQWAGVTQGGRPLPAGTYDISVESFADGDSLGVHPVEIEGRIIEARTGDPEPVVVLDTGHHVAASQVIGVREPQG